MVRVGMRMKNEDDDPLPAGNLLSGGGGLVGGDQGGSNLGLPGGGNFGEGGAQASFRDIHTDIHTNINTDRQTYIHT